MERNLYRLHTMTSSAMVDEVRNLTLQGGSSTTPWPTSSPVPFQTPHPTPASQGSGAKTDTAAKGFGWFTLSLVLLIVGLVLWRLWVRYQRQAEQRMLDYRSAQADRVLGDMQMVPNEDLDNELI